MEAASAEVMDDGWGSKTRPLRVLTDEQRAESVHHIEHLKKEITRLAGHLNAANHRFLMLIAELDRCKGWSDGATASCAHWLNWKCGVSMTTAREKVRVALALESLPKISAAMARGELSYWKVRELTRVACERTEEYLLSIALHGTADHVERTVRGFRRARDAEELSREARQQANRALNYQFDEDGSLILKARLPAEAGALVLKALQAVMDQTPPSNPPAGASEQAPSWSARRADALGSLAESFLGHGPGALNGGDRNLVTVHVAAETLRHKEAGCCEIEDGPSIAAETARRLACDASVVAIVENEDGEPLNVGRKTRTISSPLRRLIMPAIAVAASQAVRTHVGWMHITSITGRMAAKRNRRISFRSAVSTIALCTKAAFWSTYSTTAQSASRVRMGNLSTASLRSTCVRSTGRSYRSSTRSVAYI